MITCAPFMTCLALYITRVIIHHAYMDIFMYDMAAAGVKEPFVIVLWRTGLDMQETIMHNWTIIPHLSTCKI